MAQIDDNSSRAVSPPAVIAAREEADRIPPVPPAAILPRYISLSWQYVFWCIGMLAWAILCVVYFILTRQLVEMGIGIGLGVLLIAMIALPAVLFGGKTWYKRLAWITMLLSMFSLMFAYPLVAVALGIAQRIHIGRYKKWQYTDIWHLALSALTVIVSLWTILLTLRAISLARKLYKGEFGVVEIRRA